jgi:hypothetical protein
MGLDCANILEGLPATDDRYAFLKLSTVSFQCNNLE